jgi:hypothetical protein
MMMMMINVLEVSDESDLVLLSFDFDVEEKKA